MHSEGQAVIYLSSRRGCSSNEHFRSHYTFNFGSYQEAHRQPFGKLSVLNDETLKAGSSVSYLIEASTVVMLLPLVGALSYNAGPRSSGIVDVGQACLLSLPAGSTIEVINSYQTELISYLQLRLTSDEIIEHTSATMVSFDLVENPNALLPIDHEHSRSGIFIGKFDGRQEANVPLPEPDNGIFVYAIDGAFEVHNCYSCPEQ